MDSSFISEITAKLAPGGYAEAEELETKYPARSLPEGALVTRLAPSPTGFMHLGNVYAALLNERLAHQSGGVFFVRIEDTDKRREVKEGYQTIIKMLELFTIQADEGPAQGGSYGPYVQSQRADIYLGYAFALLKSGRAYPCFATDGELQEMRQSQLERKLRPGYRGEFAIWRDREPAEVAQALGAGRPFVLRFKSLGSHERQVQIIDRIKGRLHLSQNDLDIPLIKSDGLPTYHLAHVVDDHLMRTTLVIRGEEWLPSTPLHIELAEALGFEPLEYAHLAPISVLDSGTKRKLSKRKDTTADVQRLLESGYPTLSIIEYLMRLADSGYEDWRQSNPSARYTDFPFKLAKLAMSRSPLLDEQKLCSVSREVIADMPQEEFEKQLTEWAKAHDQELARCLFADKEYTRRVLAIERDSANRRKDISVWGEAREHYGYFFDEVYASQLPRTLKSEMDGIDSSRQKEALDSFLESYDPGDKQEAWLDKFRRSAERAGYSPDMATFKANPEKFRGSLADFAKIIRVRLATKNSTPDLFLLMRVMGEERVRRRLSAP